MSIFQRRLVSSTYALMKSFERRLEKLDGWIADIESGGISIEDLRSRQQRLDKEVRDTLDEKTADEEGAEDEHDWDCGVN